MTLILNCKAEAGPNNKLNLIFTISKDFKTEEKLFFLLPGKDKTSFQEDLVEKLYNKNHDIIPSNFNGPGATARKSFKKDFIDWTLGHAGKPTMSISQINDHYDDIEYDAIRESLNEGLTDIFALTARQFALVGHPIGTWGEVQL